MMMRYSKNLLATLLVLTATCLSTTAYAHKVNLFAYAEGNEIYVEGYFVDGKKAQNSVVQVYSAEGKLLLEGTTDSEGQYRFPVPEITDLNIVVNAGMGHQSEFLLPATELSEGGQPAEDAHGHAHPDEPVSAHTASTQQRVAEPSLNNQQLEAVVSKAVNEAIKPLVRELSVSQEKTSLAGIVGGVGYIIGFLGLFAFFKARQKQEGE